MLALVADFDPFAAWADEVRQRGIHIQCIAHLVEIRHLQIAALADRSAGWRQLAKNQPEQAGLSRTIGSDQSDFVAAQDSGAEMAHDALFPEAQ